MKSTPYFLFLCLIVVVKVSFFAVAILYRVVQHKDPTDVQKQNTIETLKEQLEFVYIILMSILLLINFNPWTPVSIDTETRVLLFLYGIIVLFTSKYSTFAQQSLIKNSKSSNTSKDNTRYLLA
jgi:hypothetical protein